MSPYLGSIFHCSSFQLGKYPGGTVHHVHRRRLPCFQGRGKEEEEEEEEEEEGKKFQMEMQKMKFPGHAQPIELNDEISFCTISL